MTTLGLVDGVVRTLYRDEVENTYACSLDEKIQLLKINGRYSRYTRNFSHLTGDYYARLPERNVLDLMKNIDLELDTLTSIGASIAQPYLPQMHDEVENEELRLPVVQETRFLEKRLQEINASSDRDVIIKKALEGEIAGSMCSIPSQSYL